ncbi:MAG: ATP-dependent DNA helicase [Thermoplasmata archaeon]|nr:ATP-dependent DNA helicase [Thermoplasmata archaeon]
MMGMFCPRCRSLVAPCDTRCKSCGATLDKLVESNQSVLDGMDDRRPQKEVAIEEVPEAPYMPYRPRGCQMDIIHDMVSALDAGKHFVMESGTGTGKTIVSLAACLDHASRTGKTIVYLTRTNSQSDQVMRELRSISKIKPVTGIALTGRSKSCPLFRGVKDFDSIPSNILSMMCDDARMKSNTGKAGGCRYYDRVQNALPQIQQYVRTQFPTSDELDSFCVKLQACPYEAKKALMKECRVVAAPYVHILDPDIRNSLMTNLDRPGDPESLLIVVDEAHNLVDAARGSESFTIDRALIDDAIDECTTFRSQPRITDVVSLKEFLTFLKSCVRAVAVDKLKMGTTTALIEGPVIEERIMAKYGLDMERLEEAVEQMIEIGESRTEALMQANENRISDIQQVGVLLKSWCGSSGERYVRTINGDRDGEFLRASCIDPAEISRFLNSTKGTVHMSGTLQPLDQYARVIGLSSNCTLRKYPSPFPAENRLVVYTEDMTTRWQDLKENPGMKDRLERTIAQLCNSVEKNTLVFFTSYASMTSMRGYLETHIDRRLYWEESRNAKGNAANLNTFRSRRDGVLFCVMGGKFAEGIDFPGDELCFAVIVGIPYPPPSLEQKAMSDMFDARYGPGKGWTYCSAVPAQRKIKQAIGRLIRTETDRGMAVILDNRASRLARELDAVPTKDPVGDAARFFSGRPG